MLPKVKEPLERNAFSNTLARGFTMNATMNQHMATNASENDMVLIIL